MRYRDRDTVVVEGACVCVVWGVGGGGACLCTLNRYGRREKFHRKVQDVN